MTLATSQMTQIAKFPRDLLSELELYLGFSLAPVMYSLDARWEQKYKSWSENKKLVFRGMARAGLLTHLLYYKFGGWLDSHMYNLLLETNDDECIQYVLKNLWIKSNYKLPASMRLDVYKRYEHSGLRRAELTQVVKVGNLPLFEYLTRDVKLWRSDSEDISRLKMPGTEIREAVLLAFQLRLWNFIDSIIGYVSKYKLYVPVNRELLKFSDTDLDTFFTCLCKHYPDEDMRAILGSSAPRRLQERVARRLGGV